MHNINYIFYYNNYFIYKSTNLAVLPTNVKQC